MYFHILNSDNISVISGDLVLLTCHTAVSIDNNTPCMLAYLHDVEVNEELIDAWSNTHLITNKPSGCGGKPASSEYNYIEFKLDTNYRKGYDIMVTNRRKKPRKDV